MSKEDTIKALIAYGREQLGAMSSTPQLDAELLLVHVLGVSRSSLLSSLNETVCSDLIVTFKSLIKRRKNHEPVAYIVGEREFWSLAFKVGPGVLVPRPETELLVEGALEFIKTRSEALKILELGTGSGCIAISIAHTLMQDNGRYPACSILALDKSEKALSFARDNAVRHEVLTLVEFIKSDWFDAVSGKSFDLIISNPPYVRKSYVNPDLSAEPEEALFAGADGLSDLELIIKEAPGFLTANGKLLLEFGDGQAESLESLAQKVGAYSDVKFIRDLAGNERVFCANLL